MANRFFRLPMTFERARLVEDMTHALRSTWPAHFNDRVYSGEWTSIALRSATGNAADIASVPGESGWRNTPLFDECRYFASVMDGFLCEKESVAELAERERVEG